MRVLITSAGAARQPKVGLSECAYLKLLDCYEKDRLSAHSLTDDPEEADVILFAEMPQGVGRFAACVRRHPYVRAFRDKCFVYSVADTPIAFLPGLYTSIDRRWYDPRRTRGAHYLSSHISIPPLIEIAYENKDLLFSFVGNALNAPLRTRVCSLTHPRALCEDVSDRAHTVWRDAAAADRFLASYATVLARSRFSLCPRGVGTSSLRLFESMRAGCVPVVISDQWVAPTGPDWDLFSLRVREADIEGIPALLERLEERSEGMGRLAREAWHDWFADDVSFHRVVEWCLEIKRTRRLPEKYQPGRFLAYAQVLRPLHLVGVLRDLKQWLARPRT